MVAVKSPQEIELLAEAGALLGSILDVLVKKATAGITGKALDALAQDMMQDAGGVPVFLGYGKPPYPAAICVSVNNQVVHGIPNDAPFREGDIVSIDAGLSLHDMIVDSARTVGIGSVSAQHSKLIKVTKQALDLGIAQARIGNRTGDIGYAVQSYVESNGFEVVRDLVGHGVGYSLHEDPQVPNFGSKGAGTALVEGMVIAIEPMVTIDSPDVATSSDNWSIIATSGKVAAHEEHTIAITKDGPRILTA
ncbi:MAG: type I methionyl aminopeptidase [bacterium]|nr:type I methionyl aminopeptidase [bacterium]